MEMEAIRDTCDWSIIKMLSIKATRQRDETLRGSEGRERGQGRRVKWDQGYKSRVTARGSRLVETE